MAILPPSMILMLDKSRSGLGSGSRLPIFWIRFGISRPDSVQPYMISPNIYVEGEWYSTTNVYIIIAACG